jgi:hypothetical protein
LVVLPTVCLAQDINWQEAVKRLSGEQYKAGQCILVLKKYGNEAQIGQGRLTYGDAKAKDDAVINGLVTVLAQGENPSSLADLNKDLEGGTRQLAEFCNSAATLLPAAKPGEKGFLSDIVTAAIEPLITALSKAVSAIYNDHRDDEALRRKTIQTQLEGAKWPDFDSVSAN